METATWYQVGRVAVMDLGKTLLVSALLRGMSAQRTELIALTEALKLGKDKVVNIYIDNQYAFTPASIYRTI